METMNSFLGPLAFGSTGWGDDLLRGAWITITLALWSMTLGLVMGLGLAALKLSRFVLLRWFAEGYTLFIRGMPEFLILLIVFFGSDQLINALLNAFGSDARAEVPKFVAAVAGLSAIFAAYACEIFRGAYLAVPAGQIEAAQAVGLSAGKVFRRVRFPQMWRYAIPGLGNLWMVVLKDTSLAAVIALDELLRISKLGGETEGRQLTFFAAAGALYLMMTLLSDLGRAWAEQRSRRGIAGT